MNVADMEIPKLSESGVTIGGKPLEEYLKEKEVEEELIEQKNGKVVSLYHDPRTKHMAKKEPNKHVRHYTRREINQERWKELLMASKSIDSAILTIFLSGKQLTTREIVDEVKKVLPDTPARAIQVRLNNFTAKTDLKKLLEIKKLGNKNIYRLVTPATDLTVNELRTFVYKNMDVREQVLKRHIALVPFFEKDESNDEPEKIEKEVVENLPEKKIKEVVEEAVSKALGLNVNISGLIEIVFKIGS